ncbi:RNA-binding Raly-like protein isoform X1 [Acipenser ruthenus]|uniref:RNA-binding Raly-like protein isoform X1 n=2 Tax=Acipenser ruthenus TaxID=7906 RepID=UPI00145B7A44|nr:RNA-binding Raly-like protein isoform X1 [Acipenser ruthenus]
MTLFKSEHRGQRRISMAGELKTNRPKAGHKRPGSTVYGSSFDLDYDCYQDDFYDRVYDYQRVPASLPPASRGPSLPKRPRQSDTAFRRSKESLSSKGRSSSSSNRAKLKADELQTIKRELTLIKVQIDGLLENLDRMDRQRKDQTELDSSAGGSPYRASASSPDGSLPSPSHRRRGQRERGESPELGEASDEDNDTVNNHSSDQEDTM